MRPRRQTAIVRALVRPELWLGCDRRLLILVGTLGVALIGPVGLAGGALWCVALGAVVIAGGMGWLRWLAKRDPQAFDVYQRARGYHERYLGRPRWDAGRRAR